MYERNLIDYLPSIIRDVQEYQAIMDTEQTEMVDIWQAVGDVFADQFIVDATENGVSRWEKVLNIVPKATLNLSERKFTILSRLNIQLPFTITRLEQLLFNLCGENGYTLMLQLMEYRLFVQVELTAKQNYVDVKLLLEQVVPANMVWQLSLKYNQHQTLALWSHQKLHGYRQQQLREEVLS